MPKPVDITAQARAAVAERKRPERMPTVGTFQDAKRMAQERALKPRDRTQVCETGFARVDYITGGIRPKATWLIGGDTSVGKSSAAVSIAVHNLLRGLGVLIVSAEDPIELYGERFLLRELRLSALRMRDGKLTADEREKVAKNVDDSVPWPVYISADGVPLEEVVKWVEWAIEEYDIKLVIWDYLQVFQLGRREENDRLSVKQKAKLIRTLARTTGTAEITLSQLTLEAKHVGIPTRNHIRDCRDAAHGSDVIGLLYEREPDKEDEGAHNERLIFLDKVKDGPPKISVLLDWDPFSASFRPQLPETGAADSAYFDELPDTFEGREDLDF
jgi:replicative DNA helicase